MPKVATRSDKLLIYELTTRLYGNTKLENAKWGTMAENGVGKFNNITDVALQSLKIFGITHVWYMGVIEHATMEDFSAYGIAKDHPAVIKGRAGSPYAIKDYYDVNPFLASDPANRMREFDELVQRTHKNGLKVILDFVPNHVARQYRSDAKPAGVADFGEADDKATIFKPSNNFYYLPGQPFIVPAGVNIPVKTEGDYVENPAKATGNDVFKASPSIDDWYETVKLNYGVDILDNRKTYFKPIPDTWLKMRDILAFWTKKGVDGFRCDMAEMVPVEFWSWAIPEIKKLNKDVTFIAEIYNPNQYKNYIQTGKFDYLYDKVGLYDALRRLMEGKGNVSEITKVWQTESGDIQNHMLRFLENHDEQRIASDFFAMDMFYAVPAMTVAATMGSGPLMYYFGQEIGEPGMAAEGFQGADGRTTIFDWWGVPEHQKWMNGGKFDGGGLASEQKQLWKFYYDLNWLCRKSDAIRNGGFFDLQYANTGGQSPGYRDSKLFSYLRHSAKQKLLIVTNFDLDRNYQTNVRIPREAWEKMGLNPEGSYEFKEIFHHPKATATAKASAGVPVNMTANSVLIFEIKPR
ncbi:MAG: alpha-amylase family protein [Cytophagaceae bacterium]|nr:alpha-amylase family protein [Cytophagaceae bacterium]